MTDDLDDLKQLMEAATPKPDAIRKADVLRQAEENFDQIQEMRSGARLTSKRGPLARSLEGVRQMLNTISTKAVLGVTTATAAFALVLVLPQGDFVPDVSLPELGREVTAAKVASDDEAIVVLEEAAPDARVEADATFADLAAPQAAPSGAGALEARTSGLASEIAAPTLQIAPSDPVFLQPESNSEAFSNAEESQLNVTVNDPVSTFSIDVDTASYGIVRSSLTAGQLPPVDAVRIEEMVNYFPYAYPGPEDGAAFRQTITVLPSPWNAGTQLVHIGIQGQRPAIDDRPPLNLVFLIDTSGSMQSQDKLPLLKQSFRLMLGQLRPEDQISIVTYAGSAGQVLEPTSAADSTAIFAALERLEAGGGTAGAAGLEQAYAVADSMSEENEITRVILATDGDFNVGLSDPSALEDFIADKRDNGTYLSVLGFGRGNLDDATMQALAQNGNGTASYIDTLAEARKVLVDQLSGALFPIANDVKIQVEFNPAQIAEWRLIGYETRALNREDFNNDRVDAGEIGAGHTVTAIYEVTPVGSDAVRNAPLRYSTETTETVPISDELGFLKLRYKEPGQSTSRLIETPFLPVTTEGSDDVRFSVAMAGFGQLLRNGDYLGNWGWSDAISLAQSSRGEDPFGYRAEALTLMRLADALKR